MAKLDIDFLVEQRRKQTEGESYEERLAKYRKYYEYSKNFESRANGTLTEILDNESNRRVAEYFKKNGTPQAAPQAANSGPKSDWREFLGRNERPDLLKTTADIKTKEYNALKNEPRAAAYERQAEEYRREADNAQNRLGGINYMRTGARSKQDYAADLKRTADRKRERAELYDEAAKKLRAGEEADIESSYFESWNQQISQTDAAREQAKQTGLQQFISKNAGERTNDIKLAKYNLQKWTDEKGRGHSSYPDSYIDAQIEKYTDEVESLTAADEAGRANDAARAKEEDIKKYEALTKDELKRLLEIAKNSRRAQEDLQSREWDMGGTGMSYTDTIEYYDDRVDMLERALYNVDRRDKLGEYEKVRKEKDYTPIAAATAASTAADKDVEACIDVIQSGNSDGEDARRWRGVNNVGNKAVFARKLKEEYESLYGQDEYAGVFGDVFNKLPELNSIEAYQWLTDEEYDTYNYLYVKKGEQAAEEYFALLEDDIDKRRREREKTDAAKYANDKPVDATIVSIGTNLLGFAGIVGTVEESIANQSRDVAKPLDADGRAYQNTAITQAIRGTVQEDMSDAGRFWYGVATSAADNITQKVLFGNAAEIVMAGSAATSTYYDLAEQGISDYRAVAVSVMAGVFEFAFEHMSMERIFGALDDAFANYDGLWHYIKDSVLSEFAEEAGTEGANIITNALLLGKDSEWAQKLRELNAQGVPDGDAIRQVLKDYGLQIIEAGTAGMVTGAVLGGYNALETRIKAEQKGERMKTQDVVSTTLQTLELSESEQVADLAKALKDGMDRNITVGEATQLTAAAAGSTDAETAAAAAKIEEKMQDALMKGKGLGLTADDLFTLIGSQDEVVRNLALKYAGLDLNVISQIAENAAKTAEPRTRRAAELLKKTLTGGESTAYERGLSFMQLVEGLKEAETSAGQAEYSAEIAEEMNKKDNQSNPRPEEEQEAQETAAPQMTAYEAVNKALSDATYDAVDAAYGRGESSVKESELTAAYDALNQGEERQQGKEQGDEIYEKMPDDERQRAIEDKTINITPYENGISTEQEEDLRKRFGNDLTKYIAKIGEKLGVYKTYGNKEISGKIVFSKRSIRKSANEQFSRKRTSSELSKMLTQFDGIVENAVLIEKHTDKYIETIREDPTLKRVYVLLSAYYDNGIVPVQIEVKEYTDKENKLYMAVTLNKISAEGLSTVTEPNVTSRSLASALPADTISIRELVEKINPADGKTLKYIPDGMLNDEQLAAKKVALEDEKKKIESIPKKTDNNQTQAKERADRGTETSEAIPLTERIAEKYGEKVAEEYDKKLKKSERSFKDNYGIDGEFAEKINAFYGMLNDENMPLAQIEKAGKMLAREMIETSEGYSAIDPEGTNGAREKAAERLYDDMYKAYLKIIGDTVKAGEAANGILSAEGIIAAYDLYPGEISDAIKIARGEDTGHKMPAKYNTDGIKVLAEYFKAYPTSTEKFEGEYNISDIKRTARETQNILLDTESIKAKLEGKSETAARLTHQLDEKDAQIFRMRERQRKQAEKKKQTEVNRKLRENVKRDLKDVETRLEKPTNKKHIPSGMEGIARELLDVFELDGQRRQTNEGRLFRDRVNSLAAEVKAANGTGYISFAKEIDEKVGEIQRRAGDVIYLSDANEGTLRAASELCSMITKGIREADETHSMRTKERVSELAEGAIEHLDGKKDINAVKKLAAGYNFSLMDHAAFFDLFGEKTGTKLRRAFDGALGKYALSVKEVAEYRNSVVDGKDVHRLENDKRKVKLSDGEYELTAAQLMELYELFKRKDAQEHLLNSDVYIEKKNNITGEWSKEQRIKLTEADGPKIREALTKDERIIADRLQVYMAYNCAAKGNETSRALYGYDRYQFGGDYWTMRVDDATTRTTDRNKAGAKAGLYQRPGFSKEVNSEAKNPLIIRGAFETFKNHALEMAAYNAFAPVTSDAMKLLNYKNYETGSTLKATMESKLGKQAEAFYTGLIEDINGLAQKEQSTPLISRLYGNAKAAAVAANISVIVQQPTAYMRAAAIIDPKYLIKGMKSPDTGTAKERRERMYKYAPLTYWKSVGGADINTGKSISELVLGNEGAYTKLKNGLMAGAGKADDVTWSKLWNACLWEATDMGYKPQSKKWYEAAADRMNDIIDYTQVMDSPLHRAKIMKAGGMTQLYTQFMSEPVKSINVMRHAISQAANAQGAAKIKPVMRSAAALVVTGVVNSAAKSLVYALRDDDDRDKEGNKRTYWDKWLEKFKENGLDELNFINNFPILKEIWEASEKLIKGEGAYGAASSALYEKGIDELLEFARILQDDEKSGYDKAYAGVKALSTLTGLGVNNIWRDVEALIKTFTPEEEKLKAQFYKDFYGEEDTLKEILDMYMIGNMSVVKKDTPPDTIKTSEGDEITLDSAQKQEYRDAYNVAYSQIADAVRLTDVWNKLSDDKKAAAYQKIKTQAAQEGKYAIVGYPSDDEGNEQRTSVEEYAESCIFAALTKGAKNKEEKIAAIKSALGVNDEGANYYYQVYGEHKEDEEARQKARDDMAVSWDADMDERNAKAAGLDVKEYQTHIKNIGSLESTKDAEGQVVSGSLAAKKLNYIAEQVTDDKAAIYLAKQTASSAERSAITAAEQAEALDRDFLKKLAGFAQVSGEKDADGQTIANSKKTAQLEYLSSSCTKKQSAALLKSVLTSDRQSAVAELVEKSGMDASVFAGHLAGCMTLTSSEKINDYLYSISGSADLNTRDLIYLATAGTKNEYNALLERVVNKLPLTQGEKNEYLNRLRK